MSDSRSRLEELDWVMGGAMLASPVDVAVYTKSLRVMDRDGFITRAQAEAILANPGPHPGYGDAASVDSMTTDGVGWWEEYDGGQRYRVAGWWLAMDPPADAASSVVYFAQCGVGGPIKIGRTCDIARRLAELQTASPHPLTLLAATRGATRLERIFHEEFRHARIHGEWFKPSADLLAFIAEIAGTRP